MTFALMAAALTAACGVTGRMCFRDGGALVENPGCGYAGGYWSTLVPGKVTSEELCRSRPTCTKLWSMHKYSKGYVYDGQYATYTNHVMNFVGGADVPLDSAALQSVSNALASCRRNGGMVIPRFAYTPDGYGGCEPDDFSTILTHIAQLSEVLSQFADVVPAVECGIIGAFGEMHTSRYCGAEHARPIIGAWLRGTPKSMAVLVRSPYYLTRYSGLKTDALLAAHPGRDGSDFDRLGFYNDGYLGTSYDYGTWTDPGSTASFSRDQGRAYLRVRDLAYGGEFAGVSEEDLVRYHADRLFDPAQHNLIEEWYDTHLSYLRTIRNEGMTITKHLAALPFSSAKWNFAAMPGLVEFEGTDLRTFCETHMGYRFVVRDVRVSRPGKRLRLDLAVENTGFGAMPLAPSSEIVFALSDGTTFALPATGGGWQDLRGGTTRQITLSCAMPTSDNIQHIGIRLTLAHHPVAFANADAWDAATGANWLADVRFADGCELDDGSIWGGWWFRSNGARDWAQGGAWEEDGTSGDRLRRAFSIAEALSENTACEMRFNYTAGWLSSLDVEAAPRIAGFACLEEKGQLVPYGCAGGTWHRLEGASLTEGQNVTVSFRFGRRNEKGMRPVSFAVDGVMLRESGGGASVFWAEDDGSFARHVTLTGPAELHAVDAFTFREYEPGTTMVVR